MKRDEFAIHTDKLNPQNQNSMERFEEILNTMYCECQTKTYKVWFINNFCLAIMYIIADKFPNIITGFILGILTLSFVISSLMMLLIGIKHGRTEHKIRCLCTYGCIAVSWPQAVAIHLAKHLFSISLPPFIPLWIFVLCLAGIFICPLIEIIRTKRYANA